MAKLFMLTGAGERREVDLATGDTTLGRSAINDVVTPGIFASRKHAVVTVGEAFVSIRDANSQNGTFVNGERVQTQMLAGGDVITIGTCMLRFFQSNEEMQAVEARGMPSVPNWLNQRSAGEGDADGDAPTATDGPH